MLHVAILNKSWHLLEKIVSGEKTMESRWYKYRYPPWDKIAPGDVLWFKNSGEPVKLKARVTRVLQFDNLTPKKILEIRRQYTKALGLDPDLLKRAGDYFRGKRYCILIFFDKVERVFPPFKINKSGFGSAAAWLVVDDIKRVKLV